MTQRFSYQLKVLAKNDKEEFQDEFEPSQEWAKWNSAYVCLCVCVCACVRVCVVCKCVWEEEKEKLDEWEKEREREREMIFIFFDFANLFQVEKGVWGRQAEPSRGLIWLQGGTH